MQTIYTYVYCTIENFTFKQMLQIHYIFFYLFKMIKYNLHIKCQQKYCTYWNLVRELRRE